MASVNGMQLPVSWQSLGDSLDCDTDSESLARAAILRTLAKSARITAFIPLDVGLDITFRSTRTT